MSVEIRTEAAQFLFGEYIHLDFLCSVALIVRPTGPQNRRLHWAERRHGSTRVPGHAFLVWRSSWRMVVSIYYITADGNSISSELRSSCQVNRYGTDKAGGTARPSSTKITPAGSLSSSQPARRAAALGQPSSPAPELHSIVALLLPSVQCVQCTADPCFLSNFFTVS